MTLFGPPQPYDAPLPQAPKYTLVGASFVPPTSDERWANGITIRPYQVETPDLYDQCGSGSGIIAKTTGTPEILTDFSAFTVLVAESCTTRSIGNDNDLAERAQNVLTAVESFGVEGEFERAALMPANPHLTDANAQIQAGGTVTNSINGLALLEKAIAVTGRRGVIHATPALATKWISDHMLEDDGAGKLRTLLGTIVVPGAGYQGTPPLGQAANTGTVEWAYATGPILVLKGSPFQIPQRLDQALNRSINFVTYRVERLYAYGWDRQLQAAVKIDRCQTAC